MEKRKTEFKEFKAGFNEEGREAWNRSRRKFATGRVVGQTLDGLFWKIVWPGSKKASAYHKKYIQKLNRYGK